MKGIAKRMLKALSVSALINLILLSCSAQQISNNNDGSFVLKVLNSHQKEPSLTLESFDFSFKDKIGGFVEVNDLIFDFNFNGKTFDPIILSVKKNRTYKIVFHFVGKKSLKMTTDKISVKDSVVIKAYLKNEDLINKN